VHYLLDEHDAVPDGVVSRHADGDGVGGVHDDVPGRMRDERDECGGERVSEGDGVDYSRCRVEG